MKIDQESIDALGRNPRIRRLDLIRFIGIAWNRDLKPRISNGPTRAIICMCPYHREKTPSFRMWISGKFKCLGCGKSGVWTDLIADRIHHVSTEELLQDYQKFIRRNDNNKQQTLFDFNKP